MFGSLVRRPWRKLWKTATVTKWWSLNYISQTLYQWTKRSCLLNTPKAIKGDSTNSLSLKLLSKDTSFIHLQCQSLPSFIHLAMKNKISPDHNSLLTLNHPFLAYKKGRWTLKSINLANYCNLLSCNLSEITKSLTSAQLMLHQPENQGSCSQAT